ncbi:MAG: glycosyltransferase family 2 protein [Mariprofundaceae bacterium]
MTIKICGLVPVYNNQMTIAGVIEALLEQLDYVVVVDDGSCDGSESIVDALKAIHPKRLDIVHHHENSGKGAAVQSGLQRANVLNFTHALQVDADGQHDLRDVPKFLESIGSNPDAMLLGAPIFDDDIPAVRKYGRKLTQAMIALEMGFWDVPDAMCGFRTYPVAAVCKLGRMDPRMSFDPEVMIRAHWAGIALQRIPTRVRYLSPEEGGISHFRMINDNVRHTWVHTRLLLQAPYRLCMKWMQQRNG